MRGVILIVSALAIYFIPTFIAMYRNKLNYSKIFIINAALGWTIIAWVYALIESLRNDPASLDIDEAIRLAKKGIGKVSVDLKSGNVEEMAKEKIDGLSAESKVSGGPKESN